MNSEQMVREFHEKHGIPISTKFRSKWDADLVIAKINVSASARCLLKGFVNTKNDHLLRAHLICEETAEVLEALYRGDEVMLLDALADLQYVTEGTAVTYGLPLAAAFAEVHRSNMTKQVTGEHRLRDKGKNFSPPDLKEVLRCSR